MKIVEFNYLNHRGELKRRRVLPLSLDFQKNPGYGYQPGWFLTGWCQDKKATRSFALSRIQLNTPDSLIPDFLRLKLED